MRTLISLLLLVITAACAHTPSLQSLMVDEASAYPPLNGPSCTEAGITLDCDVARPTRSIELKGKQFNIAGNKPGNIVLIMHGNECAPTPSSCWTKANNRNFGLIKSFLADKPVKILTVVGLSAADAIYGYRITFKGDAYSELLKLSQHQIPGTSTNTPDIGRPLSPHASPRH